MVTSVPVRYHHAILLLGTFGRKALCLQSLYSRARSRYVIWRYFFSAPYLRWATTWHCYTPSWLQISGQWALEHRLRHRNGLREKPEEFGTFFLDRMQNGTNNKYSFQNKAATRLFMQVTRFFDRRTSWVCFFIPGLLWLVRCHGATSDFEPPTRQTPPKAFLALLPKQDNSNPTPLFAVVLCVARKTNQHFWRFFILWPYAVGADFPLWM